jgi:hypothetical protein
MSISTLRQKLSQQKNRVGLVGGTVKVNEYDEQKEDITAHINPQGWNIEVNIRKGFNPIQDRRQKAYARKKKIDDGLETIVLHVGGLHEPAHWELPYGSGRGCPFDVYNHDKILEAIKDALPEDKKAHTKYVANAFEDMIINPRCREFGEDFSGQVLFWDWQGIRTKEKGQEGFTPFYEAFVKLNMHLWGDNVDRALLKRHYRGNNEVNEAVGKVVSDLKLPENISDTYELFDKNRWSSMARTFAKNLAHLLDESPTERLSAYSEDGQQGNGGREEKQQSGNGVEQKMRTRDGKEEISHGRYASGEKQSTNFTDFEQLDALYRRLSRAIPVNVEAMTREQGLQIGSVNYRPFDEEVDDFTKIKPSKLMVWEDGLTFGVPNQPLSITARSKIQRKGFPDFKMVVLDNSGSMKESADGSENIGKNSFIPWGDKSKYHYALLGFYGVENFLRQQGIAQYINHGVALFSSQTRFKEGDFAGLDAVRKQALKPDWGSTRLDAGVLEKALQGRQSFVLSISDGEIGNWDSERESIKKLLDNNYFAHVQIGGETGFTRDLENWDKPVFYVSSGKDLSKLMVEATSTTYRRFTHE